MSDDHTGRASEEAGYSSGAVAESPSIFHPEMQVCGIPAFEVKFVVPEPLAAAIEAALRQRLTLDPHADANLGGAYRVTTLYTETAAFDVYRRVGAYGRKKYRVRRYGDFDMLFLERKEKNGDRVRKHRIAVEEPGLDRLARLDSDRGEWSGGWFQRDLRDFRLAPICRLTYDRRAFMGDGDNGVVRATFDRNIHGELAGGWEVRPVRPQRELLSGQVVCEFKYRLAMPAFFKEIVERYGLNPTPWSKYRRFIDSSGIAPASGENGAIQPGGPRDV